MVEDEPRGPQTSINSDVDLSLVLATQIVRLLHEARADKDVALSALNAAVAHMQCLNRAALV
jgi:hypothetical protein